MTGNKPNKQGTYEIQTKNGKVVRKYRTKALSLMELRQLQLMMKEDLVIVQVKETPQDIFRKVDKKILGI